MRVLVLWAGNTSANLGVRVLAEGMAALARAAWGQDTQVDFQDYGPGDSTVGFGGRSIIRDIGRRSGPIKQKLRGYDVILDSGAGDSLADIYGIKRLVIMNYAHRTASQLSLPLVLGPQTVGPFTTRLGRALGRDSLRRTELALLRDSQSRAFALILGSRREALATDVVFALPHSAAPTSRDVIVNVSGLLWGNNCHVDSVRYREEVFSLVSGLLATGREVALLAHVLENPTADNDVPAVQEVAAQFGDRLEVLVPTDLNAARSSIASARLVIGSRMHACLNALSLGVPAVPWAYSRKFAPLMNDLGWPYGYDLRDAESPSAQTLALIQTTPEETFRAELDAVRQTAGERLTAATAAMQSISPAQQKVAQTDA
jgi:colanic acid/amylovoran biosynthesis protein